MSQTVKEPSDVDIRKAIASVIRGALVELYADDDLANEVKVHDHWLWGFALGENAAVLRVTNGVEKGKIHAWMIGVQAVTRQRPVSQSEVPNRQGAHRLRNMGPNRRDILRSYRVWCYHQLDTGTTDENSENRLTIEIEAIADAFSRNPLIGIDNVWLMGAEEIQFSPIDVYKFGEAQANVAQGTLNVRLQKPLDLNQY